MSLLIDTADYYSKSYSFDRNQDFSLVEHDLMTVNQDKYERLDVKDPRFSKASWTKAHGCAAYSLTAFAYCPSKSLIGKSVRNLSWLCLPLAHAEDILVNGTLIGLQTGVVLDNLTISTLTTIINKFLSTQNQLRYSPRETEWLEACGWLGDSFAGMFIDTFLLPFSFIFNMDYLRHSYWVYNNETQEFEILLDQNKVQWLKKKHGYPEGVDQIFKEISIPKNEYFSSSAPPTPSKLKIEYTHSIEKPMITASWIAWRYLYTIFIGNTAVHHYEPYPRSSSNHYHGRFFPTKK